MSRTARNRAGLAAALAALTTSVLAQTPPPTSAVSEMTERRTMTSRAWQNDDGTCIDEYHLAPIHYRTQEGDWQPIQTALHPTLRTGFGHANETNVLKAYLPMDASGWVRVEVEGKTGEAALSFRPLGTTTSFSSVEGDRLTQSGAWPYTDLAYTVEPGRLKETLTLTGSGSPSSFSFALRLEGLFPVLNANGSVSCQDPSGGTVLRLESPWMADAEGRHSSAIDVSLKPDGVGWTYTLTPDPAWLAQASYRVVLDPTVTYDAKHGKRAVVRAAADTVEYPGLAYYGYSSGQYPAFGTQDTEEAVRTVFQFRDADPLNVVSASLHMEVDHREFGQDTTLQAELLRNEQDELPLAGTGGVTWETVEDARTGVLSVPYTNPFDDYYTYLNLNVTDIVKEWFKEKHAEPFSDIPSHLDIMVRDTSDSGTQKSGLMLWLKEPTALSQVYLTITYPLVYARPHTTIKEGGNDTGTGTVRNPYRTLTNALASLTDGETLYLLPGDIVDEQTGERAMFEGTVAPTLDEGQETGRIVVYAYPGHNPTLKGLLRLNKPDYWTFSGLNVTWPLGDPNVLPKDHMVKIEGGTSWIYQNSEIWGAESYAGMLVGYRKIYEGSVVTARHYPSNWVVRGNVIHDTYATNATNQDHLLYINNGAGATNGLVERNILFNSSESSELVNGSGIKLGPADEPDKIPPYSFDDPQYQGAFGVTVRYNTIYNTRKAILIGNLSAGNSIYRNLMVRSRQGGVGHIQCYKLTGLGNAARNNRGFLAPNASLIYRYPDDPPFNALPYLDVTDNGDNVNHGNDDPEWLNPTFTPGFEVNPVYPEAAYGRYAVAP